MSNVLNLVPLIDFRNATNHSALNVEQKLNVLQDKQRIISTGIAVQNNHSLLPEGLNTLCEIAADTKDTHVFVRNMAKLKVAELILDVEKKEGLFTLLHEIEDKKGLGVLEGTVKDLNKLVGKPAPVTIFPEKMTIPLVLQNATEALSLALSQNYMVYHGIPTKFSDIDVGVEELDMSPGRTFLSLNINYADIGPVDLKRITKKQSEMDENNVLAHVLCFLPYEIESRLDEVSGFLKRDAKNFSAQAIEMRHAVLSAQIP